MCCPKCKSKNYHIIETKKYTNNKIEKRACNKCNNIYTATIYNNGQIIVN